MKPLSHFYDHFTQISYQLHKIYKLIFFGASVIKSKDKSLFSQGKIIQIF